MAVPDKRRDEGASLVEFALILPLFVMLILGMFSGGIALNDKQQMTHAVREGARYGATIPASEFSNDSAFADAVRAEVVSRSNGVLEAADVCVSVVRGTPDSVAQGAAQTPPTSVKPLEIVSSTAGSACDPSQTYPLPSEDGDSGQRIQVRATHPTRIELGLFGSFTITLDESATAKSEYDS